MTCETARGTVRRGFWGDGRTTRQEIKDEQENEN